MLPADRTTLPNQPATGSPNDTRASVLNWRSTARCSQTYPRLFDPFEANESPRHRAQRLQRARQVCEQCPVATRCLIEALKHRDVGVRGGLLLTRRSDTTARVTAYQISDTKTDPQVAA